MLDDAVHLGPLRASIAATYANESFSGFGRSGAGAPQSLRVNGSVADAVSAWYAEHLDGWRLSLKKDSDSFSLRLVKSSSLSINLALGGEGLQQVLPVVTHQLWRQMQRAQSFVDVIEQPELHLHPAAQAPLADLFIDTARKGSGTTIVETNSEGILLRTQRRIAEGSIRPDQVAIYYVEGGASGSALRKIEILENGEMEWWPSGVFEEDFSEVAAIRRAQRASSDQVKE
jgi:predicted ATP-dependent endonuclease of OLD family